MRRACFRPGAAMLFILGIYLAIGAFVGILAGSMGLGGALVMVPILHFTLPRQGVDPSVVHYLAIATSMANILFTSCVSTWQHHKRGVVPWRSVVWMVPGILGGSFAGSYATSYIPSGPLTVVFACFQFYAAVQMFVNIKPKASRNMPGIAGSIGLGVIIGVLSGILGIGGAAVSIPILMVCGLSALSSIASAGAFGFPIAVAGCLGYMVTAWGHPGLPEYSLGFIYLPALLGLVPASMLTTPLGVKLSHSLPTQQVKRGLGVLFIFVACHMIYRVLV